MTQQFFIDGDRHEAADWKDVHLPPDDAPEVDSELEFKSFDKIPKRRGPLLTMFAIATCFLVGTAAWAAAFQVLRARGSLRQWAAAVVGGRPVASPFPGGSVPVVPVAAAVPVQADAPAVAVAGPPPVARQDIPAPVMSATAATQHETPASAPSAAAQQISAAGPSSRAEQMDRRDVAKAKPSESITDSAAANDDRRHGRQGALRGYVWSPEKGQLIPASPAATVGDQPRESGHADEHGATPDVAPPRPAAVAPAIAPPDIGSPASERPAPSSASDPPAGESARTGVEPPPFAH